MSSAFTILATLMIVINCLVTRVSGSNAEAAEYTFNDLIQNNAVVVFSKTTCP
jgi:hypothetical protein